MQKDEDHELDQKGVVYYNRCKKHTKNGTYHEQSSLFQSWGDLWCVSKMVFLIESIRRFSGYILGVPV